MRLVWGILALRNVPYWLTLTDMLDLIASLNFRQLTYIENVLMSRDIGKPVVKVSSRMCAFCDK